MEPVSIILTTVGWLVSAVIRKAVGESWERYTKSKKFDEKIQRLITEFEKIHMLLEGANSVQLPSNREHLLKYLKEVKDLAYESSDILDDLDYFRLQKEVKLKSIAEQSEVRTAVVVPFIESKFNRLSLTNRPSSSATNYPTSKLKFDKKEMSDRIESVVKKLQEKYEHLHNILLHLQQLSSIAPAIQHPASQILYTNRPQTTSYTHETHVYGRDVEINKILELISNGESHTKRLPVIAIVGNGGVGKTTLAQVIHNHPKLENQFDLRIWICVSIEFDDMKITRQMLEHCSDDGRKYDGENMNNLKRILKSRWEGKKVLLVLDDIWVIKSDKDWNSLLAPLNPNISTMIGSTVLVTTRDHSIANRVKTIDPVIQLDGLQESSFWSLFKNCVFGDDQYQVPHEIEDIGKAIVKRLKGYPLAAKTVGALLNGNIDARHWLKVLESEQWKFQDGNDVDSIMPALRLSYEYLDAHLQQCFSYCSLFPKDYEFKAEELVYMWMAHEYIHTDDKRVEDVGYIYLEILVQRAFLQKKVNTRGEVVCVLHDLMHDLAQIVSKEELLAIDHPLNDGRSHSFNHRHLSFLIDVEPTIESCVQFQNLRSLLIFQNYNTPKNVLNRNPSYRVDPINWLNQSYRVGLRLLIILPNIRPISYNFSRFTHLRYLKLNFFNFVTFPVQICTLYHLQVLELEDAYKLDDLPKEFNNLVNLRHFIDNGVLHSRIAGVGRLKHLQELKNFEVREKEGFELGQLSELKELRGSLKIHSLQNVKSRDEAESVGLSQKELEELQLTWDEETKDKPRLNRGDKGKWRMWLNGKGKECRATAASSEQILEALRPNNELRCLCIKNYWGCKSPSWLTNHSIKFLESIYL